MPTGKLAVHGGTPAIPPGAMKQWPPIDETDRRMVLASLEQSDHTYGPNCKALEAEFAQSCGLKHVLTCNSGTAALHMALVGCGLECGDEVLVPAYSWPSSATCCLHHNMIPVFVDIEWASMNVDVTKLEAAVTPRTKAIIAVHLHGLTVDMDPLLDVAQRHNLAVIEDCCQAHGAAYKGRPVGTMGRAAAYSCNQNKVLCSGEGGFFATDDEAVFERGKMLWYFGEHRPPDRNEYQAYGMGWMYRNNDLTAAFARAQLSRLPTYLQRQAENAARLSERLADVEHLILPTVPDGHGHNYYNYTIRFDMEALGHAADAARFRDKLVTALKAEGAETGVWQGWPLPEMTAFQARNAYGRGCPWRCTDSRVSYDVAQFPVARKHCDWHTGMTFPLRYPNDGKFIDLLAGAWAKVMAHVDEVERIET